MTEETTKSSKGGKVTKDKDGDEEMTVVVPPPKSSNTPNGTENNKEGDVLMNGATEGAEEQKPEPPIDPKEKAVTGKMLSDKLRYWQN